MSIVVSDVRTQIQDKPRMVPPTGVPPEALGIADGFSTDFFFKLPNVLLNSPMQISFGTEVGTTPNIGMRWTEQLKNDPVNGWAPIENVFGSVGIRFINPPADGIVVSGRYMICMFSDAELASYLDRAKRMLGDDRLILLQCQYDLIGVMLMNEDKFRVLTFGDTKNDPTQLRMGYEGQRAAIMAELRDPTLLSGPSLSIGCADSTPYIR